jgi:hypothetical protein
MMMAGVSASVGAGSHRLDASLSEDHVGPVGEQHGGQGGQFVEQRPQTGPLFAVGYDDLGAGIGQSEAECIVAEQDKQGHSDRP